MLLVEVASRAAMADAVGLRRTRFFKGSEWKISSSDRPKGHGDSQQTRADVTDEMHTGLVVKPMQAYLGASGNTHGE